MMLMIPRRTQSLRGEGSGLLGQLVKRPLDLVGFLALLTLPIPLIVPLIAVNRLDGVDEQSVLAPSQVLGRDATVAPD
jgi:hypothetical protein